MSLKKETKPNQIEVSCLNEELIKEKERLDFKELS